ncbi:GNAT family N-acetyltransferase [Allobranchiibius sp. CTAmp26]|uniref:GNAT family N-acetyltransferase n=1 Tax=Allobranchiibius sp. CTAmp26 TaxID=2815214 RepID=UPI001AA12F12|nr:GNAT family N-acetyltransferase [Allobranchiibius sp. CTAmp26]MBO1756917.1 GNAT family N-acetyltransferase [Allobranchiibius sp. CTAmp26]
MSDTFDVVTTARLTLRAASTDDVDALFPITSDPDTWQHAPDGRHRDRQTTRDWLTKAADRWDSDGLSYWIIRLRETGEAVGVGGVQRQTTGNWNLYYRLTPHTWGRGFATELSRSALATAHAKDNSVAVIAWILESHSASRRVAERVGLTNYGPHVDPSDGTTRLAFADRTLDVP